MGDITTKPAPELVRVLGLTSSQENTFIFFLNRRLVGAACTTEAIVEAVLSTAAEDRWVGSALEVVVSTKKWSDITAAAPGLPTCPPVLSSNAGNAYYIQSGADVPRGSQPHFGLQTKECIICKQPYCKLYHQPDCFFRQYPCTDCRDIKESFSFL